MQTRYSTLLRTHLGLEDKLEPPFVPLPCRTEETNVHPKHHFLQWC